MIKDVIQQAVDSLKFHRSRAALTMLGMAWGIATVVLLLAYGDGFDRAIHSIFATFGAKTIQVFGGRTSIQAGGAKAGASALICKPPCSFSNRGILKPSRAFVFAGA